LGISKADLTELPLKHKSYFTNDPSQKHAFIYDRKKTGKCPLPISSKVLYKAASCLYTSTTQPYMRHHFEAVWRKPFYPFKWHFEVKKRAP